MMLVCYDVTTTDAAGARRLRSMAKLCQAYGVRVQKSVFEVNVPAAQLVAFRAGVAALVEPHLDTVRIYVVQPENTEVLGQAGPVVDHKNWVL